MYLFQMLQRAPAWYRAACENPSLGMSVHAEGPVGMGKTQGMCSLPPTVGKEMNQNVGLVIINGTTLNDIDINGFGLPKHYENHSEMIFSKPFYWRSTEGKLLEEYDGGIIFVDEYDKLPPECKKALTEGKLSGRIGPHTLPRTGKGRWLLWSAGNRAKDKTGSTRAYNHDINRTWFIELKHHLDGWNDWASRNNVPPIIQSFANANAQIVFKDEPPEKDGPFTTPRSLVDVGMYGQSLAGPGNPLPDDRLFAEEAAGHMGHAEAQLLIAHIQLEQKLPSFEKIVANPTGVPVPEGFGPQLLVVFNCGHRVSKETIEPVLRYINRFDKEQAIPFCRTALKREPMLIIAPAFAAWSRENASVINSVNSIGRATGRNH